MKISYQLLLLLLATQYIQSQRLYRFNDSGKSSTKEFDLIDTQLDLSFNFEDQTVNGKAKITLKPHFTPTDKLQLDAKSMKIFTVESNGKKLNYYNSGEKLNIDLPKVYTQNDTLSLFIKYKGNPNSIKNNGGVAITDNKGLYFINPLGTDKTKPTQIWSQGEPEQNSVWFPTIDKPNQKSTQEIKLTVPNQYKTLSNGILISETINADGTRTDYWKQSLPHAPYLFFVGIGNFEVIKQSWRGKEVNFYVEPAYKDTASELFKHTTEMLTFFSKITGIEYPWDKYSQMIVRDYVSGAMENTGAVIHAEQAMQTKGELSERNNWESIIAHEMFHHWFGDLVTTESWANITVNESFANYSEFLWFEHKYGNDRAAEHLLRTKNAYLDKNALQENYEKHLVRYNYTKKDDVFDVVSYNKGGMILHMLRNYLGDDKFFTGLNNYLTKHQFKSAEAHDLRLAFEEISGEDLMWFFSQWYYSNGHPRLKVNYETNVLTEKTIIKITQTEKEFDFPLAIDIYTSKGKQSLTVFMDTKEKKFEFPLTDKIKLIKINSDHVLLAEIETPELTTDELIFQYNNVAHYVDRLEALKQLKDKQDSKDVFKVFEKAIYDDYHVIQSYAIEHINLAGKFAKKKTITKLVKLAKNTNPNVAASAISTLGKLVNSDYMDIYKKGLESISPKIKGNSLLAIYYIDKKLATEYAKGLSNEVKDIIHVPLLKIYLEEKDKSQVSFVAKYLISGLYFLQDDKLKKNFEEAFEWVATTNNIEAIQVMVDDFVEKGLRYKKYNFNYEAIRVLRTVKDKQIASNNSNKIIILETIDEGIKKLAID
ncbi:M1 family aminopeptidase [Wenyingzhuangia sp. IMCC45533]